jgi:hypothetical protein
MKLSINDNVTWSSAAGQLTGVIVNMVLDLNAAKKIVPWIDIKTNKTTVRLCATDSNLKMMKVQLVVDAPEQVERTNFMTGKKFMESVDTPYFCSPRSETYWSM